MKDLINWISGAVIVVCAVILVRDRFLQPHARAEGGGVNSSLLQGHTSHPEHADTASSEMQFELAEVPAGKVGPKLSLPGRGHDWGELLEGHDFEHTIPIRNAGDMPLVIHQVLPGCGCTSVEYDAEVAPGTTAQVVLRVDSAKVKTGKRFSKLARIFTNEPGQPMATYELAGELLPVFARDPEHVILRGLQSRPKSATVRLLTATGEDVSIMDVQGTTDFYTVREVEELVPGRAFQVHLEAPPFERTAVLRDPLRVRVRTHDGVERQVIVPVTVEHTDRIQLVPAGNVVFLPTEIAQLKKSPERPITRRIQVQSGVKGYEFRVASAEVECDVDDLFDVHLAEAGDGHGYVASLTLNRPFEGPMARAELLLHTDDEEIPIKRVLIYAYSETLGDAPSSDGVGGQ